MNTQKSFVIIIIFIVITFFLINHSSENFESEKSIENIKHVKIAEQSIRVDLALTLETQAQGLSGRSELKKDEGMLFVFPQSDNYSFWMKDMNFAIDIIWLGDDLRIVYIKKDARPELYPETYGLDVTSKYVLEVVSGFSDKYNLKEGDEVEFTY